MKPPFQGRYAVGGSDREYLKQPIVPNEKVFMVESLGFMLQSIYCAGQKVRRTAMSST